MTLPLKFFLKTKHQSSKVLSYLSAHWKSLVIVVVPLLFSPLIFLQGKEAKCAYVICVMAFYWMTEALPLPVTSLIPIVLLPVFNILSTEKACLVYFKETNVMFLGGVLMALAIEQSNLHKRIGLKVLLMVGTSPRRLLLGFMVTTMFLSMWICNSAATSLMVPVVDAVLDELRLCEGNGNENRKASAGSVEVEPSSRSNSITVSVGSRSQCDFKGENRDLTNFSKEKICYFLGVAYAANIGGTGTLTGTATNLLFKGTFESLFPEAPEIDFAGWMKFNVILMLFNTFLAWIWLQILYMRFGKWNKNSKESAVDSKSRVRTLIKESYDKLGPMTYHEGSVLFLFILDVLLWLFRKPEFVTGWGGLFPENQVKDATSAIGVAILLFILPANSDFLKLSSRKKCPPLLDWKVVKEKMPFGIILLLGGGFAISEATRASGLSDYIGQQLQFIEKFSPILIMSLVILVAIFVTEISSNTAVASILLPVLAKTSSAMGLHPLYLMMPATIACSYAFMLPVATPPNAIVASTSNIKTTEMVRAGIGMNLMCMVSLLISFLYIGIPIYHLTTFPDWANNGNLTLKYG